MEPVSTNIKLDPDLKRDAQVLFDNLGLSMSAAVSLFLRQSVREQAIPFRVGASVYNDETLEAIRDARQGRNVSRTFDSVEEMFEALDDESLTNH